MRGEVFGRSRPLERARRSPRRHRARASGDHVRRTRARAGNGASRRSPTSSRRPRRSPICGCASAASPCAMRTASCASASWSSRPIRRSTLASAGAILIDGNGRVAAHWYAQGRDRTSAPRRDGGPARHLPPARRGHRQQPAGRAPRKTDIDAGLTAGRPALARLADARRLARRARRAAARVRLRADRASRRSTSTAATAGQRLSATLEVARDLDGPRDRHACRSR